MYDKKHYNLQFKLVCLMKNIQNFVDHFDINIQPHHKLWETNNFNFPIEEKMIDIVISNEIKVKEKTKRLEELQQKLLSMELDDNLYIQNISDDDIELYKNKSDSELDIPKEYSGNKRKRKNGKNKVTDINILGNNDETRYEIEKILGHKIVDNEYQFLIKWKDYDDEHKGWIPINNFKQKEMLNMYANQH